jgi:hypothetical protein
VKPKTLLIIFLANGFVTFYYWSSYQHGMPAGQMVLYLVISLIAINAAIAFGRWLAMRPRQK